MKKTTFLVVFLFVGMTAANVNALSIDANPTTSVPTSPDITWVLGDNYWVTNDNSNLSIAEIETLIFGSPTSTLEFLYKQDQGGGEEGPFAASYDTAFFNSPGDPADATISYVGPPAIDSSNSPIYISVKDGNQVPAQYFFEVNVPGDWNGTDDILLTGFWENPQQGAISHVAIYGGEGGNEIPEPATMLLFGTGIAGLAAVGRRARK